MIGIIETINHLRDRLDEKFAKIDDKMEKVNERVNNVDMHLSKLDSHFEVYNTQLIDHIEGVKQNRETSKLLKDYIDIEKRKMEDRINSIELHIVKDKTKKEIAKERTDLFFRIIGAIASVIGFIYTIYKILEI